jgi:uncharacterized membrane protein YtjA (UPF0391 family)
MIGIAPRSLSIAECTSRVVPGTGFGRMKIYGARERICRSRVARFKPTFSEMLSWAVTYLILAVLAAVIAFSGAERLSTWIWRGICVLLVIACIVAVAFS